MQQDILQTKDKKTTYYLVNTKYFLPLQYAYAKISKIQDICKRLHTFNKHTIFKNRL